MKPICKIGSHDYTEYVEELAPSDNDLDKEGSGRNVLNGLMHRTWIATKEKWTLKFLDLDEKVMSRLLKDMHANHNYVKATFLDAETNKHLTKTYYCATINKGVQRYNRVEKYTFYEGVTFSLTER